VSYRKAPLATLDALSFRDIPAFYNFLQKVDGLDGAVILQTCNRVEVFLDAKDPSQIRDDILREWSLETKFKLGELTKLVEAREGSSVVEFLVRLATGLESMLIGENQIVGQLKNSLTTAQPPLSWRTRCTEPFPPAQILENRPESEEGQCR
jgi:glutamyl-tRNA reductase